MDDAATHAYSSQQILPAEWYARECLGSSSMVRSCSRSTETGDNHFAESAAEQMLATFATINPMCAARMLCYMPSLAELLAMTLQEKIQVNTAGTIALYRRFDIAML